MFENKTLIAVGDSFVYGHLGDDMAVESCHARSWVSKLARIGNFKSWVNLAAPGGSNDRSFDVVHDYLNESYDKNNEYLVIFAVSELARFQLPVSKEDGVRYGIFSAAEENTRSWVAPYNFAVIGPWVVDALAQSSDLSFQKMAEFLRMYYGSFVHDHYEEVKLNQKLFSLKYMFDSLNIEYYFTETICHLGLLKRMRFLNQTLPTIDYQIGHQTYVLSDFLQHYHHRKQPCGHFDDRANEFLARYIYQYMIKDRGTQNAI